MKIKESIRALKLAVTRRIDAVIARHPRATLHPRATYYTITEGLKGDLLIYGGYAAYTIILALFPFVIFLVALASVVGSPQLAEQAINYSFEVFPPEMVNILAPVVREIMSQNDQAVLTAAVFGVLWIASSGVEGIRHGLNAMYGVTEPRPVWKRRLQGLGFVVAMAGAFLLLATLLIVWPVMEEFMGDVWPWLESGALGVLRYVFAFGLLVTGMSIVYRYLPNNHARRGEVWEGAVVAALLWMLLAGLFSLYLVNIEQYALRYGSFAGGILTLVFLQLSASVVLFGGKYNAVLKRLRSEPPLAPAPVV